MPNTPSIGDIVSLHRNMDHPAWRVRHENEYGEISSTPRPGIVEDLGQVKIKNTRHHPQIGEPGTIIYQPERNLILLSNGFWYDVDTGMQENSGATYFTA